jgi:hypothetical protein
MTSKRALGLLAEAETSLQKHLTPYQDITPTGASLLPKPKSSRNLYPGTPLSYEWSHLFLNLEVLNGHNLQLIPPLLLIQVQVAGAVCVVVVEERHQRTVAVHRCVELRARHMVIPWI